MALEYPRRYCSVPNMLSAISSVTGSGGSSLGVTLAVYKLRAGIYSSDNNKISCLTQYYILKIVY